MQEIALFDYIAHTRKRLSINCFVVVAWLVESVWRLAVDVTNNISRRDIIK